MTTETLAGGAPGDGASPASFQTSGPGAEGDMTCAGPGAHPDWLTALIAMQPPVVSANDGACVCGAEDGLFADPDPDCGLLRHRLAAAAIEPQQPVDEEPHPYVCPTCGGNGCRTCAGSGELVEWTR